MTSIHISYGVLKQIKLSDFNDFSSNFKQNNEANKKCAFNDPFSFQVDNLSPEKFLKLVPSP